MKTEKVLFLVAACFASAGFSTGLAGLQIISACSIGASVLALIFFSRESNLPEGKVWPLVALSTASTVMSLIAWKAPSNDESIMAVYGAPGAILILTLWVCGYVVVRRQPTAHS